MTADTAYSYVIVPGRAELLAERDELQRRIDAALALPKLAHATRGGRGYNRALTRVRALLQGQPDPWA